MFERFECLNADGVREQIESMFKVSSCKSESESEVEVVIAQSVPGGNKNWAPSSTGSCKVWAVVGFLACMHSSSVHVCFVRVSWFVSQCYSWKSTKKPQACCRASRKVCNAKKCQHIWRRLSAARVSVGVSAGLVLKKNAGSKRRGKGKGNGSWIKFFLGKTQVAEETKSVVADCANTLLTIY